MKFHQTLRIEAEYDADGQKVFFSQDIPAGCPEEIIQLIAYGLAHRNNWIPGSLVKVKATLDKVLIVSNDCI